MALDPPQIFQAAGALARHAALRQRVAAENVANADTPGYRARKVEAFAEAWARGAAGPEAVRVDRDRAAGPVSPDGNSVAIEDQLAAAGAAARDHETATLIYAKALGLLRAALGGGR